MPLASTVDLNRGGRWTSLRGGGREWLWHRADPNRIRVRDGCDRLRLDAAGQPVSVALRRNLGGFPAGRPYRSIGVEPMLGRVFDLAAAGPGDAATAPASGRLARRLTIEASRDA